MDDEYDELEREIEKQRKKARNTQKTKKVGVEDVVKNLLDNNKRNEADQKGTEEVEVLLNSEFRNHPGEDAEGKNNKSMIDSWNFSAIDMIDPQS